MNDYPILEYDPVSKALVEPSMLVKPSGVSEYCVLCFFSDVITDIIKEYNASIVKTLSSEMGKHYIYEITVNEKRINFFHPGIGAPLAAAFLEELIALGCKKFIAAGGCGALVETIDCGEIIVPVSAVRDEGLSYHYLPPAREVQANTFALDAIKQTLADENTNFVSAKTWTTDAFYRETENRAKTRIEEGCVCVEMEAAGLMAAAEYRNVIFGQILYAGDLVCKSGWKHRDWNLLSDIRKKMFWLAVKACVRL